MRGKDDQNSSPTQMMMTRMKRSLLTQRMPASRMEGKAWGDGEPGTY